MILFFFSTPTNKYPSFKPKNSMMRYPRGPSCLPIIVMVSSCTLKSLFDVSNPLSYQWQNLSLYVSGMISAHISVKRSLFLLPTESWWINRATCIQKEKKTDLKHRVETRKFYSFLFINSNIKQANLVYLHMYNSGDGLEIKTSCAAERNDASDTVLACKAGQGLYLSSGKVCFGFWIRSIFRCSSVYFGWTASR